MNIMHRKTVKFIMQLRHATQGRTTQHKQRGVHDVKLHHPSSSVATSNQ